MKFSFSMVYSLRDIFLNLFLTVEQVPDQSEGDAEEEVTKPPLTGIPQIDYIWDPNLPRELNG